jgi:trans-aconitate methyltransferase
LTHEDADTSGTAYSKHWLSSDERRIAQREIDVDFLIHKVHLDANSKVLDFGCGDGEFALMLKNISGADVFGFEISDRLKNIAVNNGLRIVPNLNEISQIDLIVIRGVLQYVENHEALLQTLVSICRTTNSVAILMTPNSRSLQYRFFHSMPILKDESIWLKTLPDPKIIIRIMNQLGYDCKKQLSFATYFSSPYSRPLHDMWSFTKRVFLRNVQLEPWSGNVFNLICKRR